LKRREPELTRRTAGIAAADQRGMTTLDQSGKAEAFREMHHGASPLVLPNAWDPGTAVMAVDAGFGAVATTSGGVAWALGRPDGEAIGRDEMLRAIAAIAARVDVPVSADMETGYGREPETVAETVRLTLGAGAVGINLEDGVDHAAGTVMDLALAAERIAAARAAANAAGIPLVINARTDVYFDRAGAPEALFEAAATRANAYLGAGADSAFVIAVNDAAAIDRLAAAIAGPLNIVAGSGGFDVAGLAALGVKRISLATGLARAAFGAYSRALEELRDGGTLSFLEGTPAHPALNKLFTGR
jgi:2-methylisocitrate lyase-like PEP mutase family enzyme